MSMIYKIHVCVSEQGLCNSVEKQQSHVSTVNQAGWVERMQYSKFHTIVFAESYSRPGSGI